MFRPGSRSYRDVHPVRCGPPARKNIGLPGLAVNQITTYHWNLEKDLAEYAAAGVAGIGIWRNKLADYDEEKAIELILDSGLKITSLCWAGGFTGSAGFSFDEVVEDTCSAIRLAGNLGARNVLLVSGSQGSHIRTHARRLVIEGLKECADVAADFDVGLALQPMRSSGPQDWSFLRSIDETLAIVETCDHPHVAMSFSLFHLWRESDLMERLPRVVPYIASVQLSDCSDPQSPCDQQPIGGGRIPSQTILRALLELGYAGPFELELWSESWWKADYRQLLRQQVSVFDALTANRRAAAGSEL